MQRVSKDEARLILEVADSTIDRRIHRGELQTAREGRRVWVLLEDEVVERWRAATTAGSPKPAGAYNAAPAEGAGSGDLIILQERLQAQDQLLALYKTQNTDWEKRYYELKEQLDAAHRIAENATRALPPGPAPTPPPDNGRRSWWPWRRNAGP